MNGEFEDCEAKTVISLKNVSLAYKLYDDPKDRLREALHPFRKKYHKNFFAIKNIDLDVRKGEILGIVGKNGSGKSTLLKIVAGILQPTKGTVQVKGRVSALLELGSGFNPEYTGMENIFFYGSLLGFTKSQMEEKFQSIVEFAEIGQFIYQPVKTYSSGMKARLAFAVSTAIDPDILILDEILAVGDQLFRRKCYSRMERFIENGKTILYVSHSSGDVNRLCDYAILLDGGELILQGKTRMVTKYYEKYLYSKGEDSANVRKTIKRLNRRNKNDCEDICLNFDNEKSKGKVEIGNVLEEKSCVRKKGGRGSQKDDYEQEPYLIPNFLPKSTMEYRNFEVDIFDIGIYTPGQKQVNALVVNQPYVYSYKVRFHVGAENVSFGMKIKTEKGLNISGAASHKNNRQIAAVRPGDVFQVDWNFNCFLNEGIYYTNAGVVKNDNDKLIFLNRIVDAMVFKVLRNPSVCSTGLVHLSQELNINKVPA